MKKATIIAKNLTLGYPNRKPKKAVLENLSFQLFENELTCLLGPNGVGKSTLIKAILGQLKPWGGELILNSKNVQSFSTSELSKALSVVLSEPVLPGNMTVGQLVALGRIPHTGWTGRLDVHDRDLVENALYLTKIEYLKDERLSEISDGQRQKAMIARALAQDGKLMVLDEPTAHLDLVNRYQIMHLLRDIAKKQHKSILVVTHDLEIALETADRLLLLGADVPLIAGLPEDLVVTGQLDRILPGKEFLFNIEKGKIEQRKPISKMIFEGNPTVSFWVKKALEKAGINELEHPVFISEGDFTLCYLDQEFHRIGELVDFIFNQKTS
jgi:iron complex transport system ATP-binding protein